MQKKLRVLKLDSNHSSYRRTCADAEEVLPPCNQHHHQLISPDLAYNLFLSILFGVVALSTVRFKFLWTPHMCVLAGACASHHQMWEEMLRRLGVQGKAVSCIPVCIHLVVLWKTYVLLSEKISKETFHKICQLHCSSPQFLNWSSSAPVFSVWAQVWNRLPVVLKLLLLYLQRNLVRGIGVGLLIAALCLKVCVLVLYLFLYIKIYYCTRLLIYVLYFYRNCQVCLCTSNSWENFMTQTLWSSWIG